MSEESTVETTGAEVEVSTEEAEAASVSGEEEETQSSEDSEVSEETNSQEAEEGDEDERESGQGRNLTAEERKAQLQQEIRELANTKRALKETLAAEVEEQVKSVLQKAEAEKPPFIDVPWDRINDHVAAEMEEIENLKAEGKAAQALFKQRALDKLCAEIEENEAKRQQWQSEQEAKARQPQQTQWTEQAISEAAEIVRKSRGVKPDDWKLVEQWFDAKVKEDPLIGLQYREKLTTQGPAHAIIWKHEYVTQEIGKKAKSDKERREDGKGKQLSASPENSGKGVSIKTFAEFRKLSGKQQVEFAKTHPKAFEKIMENKMSTAL